MQLTDDSLILFFDIHVLAGIRGILFVFAMFMAVDDLLRKRNRRRLGEIHARLSQWENIIVPWGAAHMPEIASYCAHGGRRSSGVVM